jgi:DNA-binding beta-propeller fold protein YncE
VSFPDAPGASTSIIDARTLETVDSVATPADLVALGGKPHDVIVDANGFYGYITVIGVAGDNDRLLQVDARSHEIVRVIEVGDDPHVSLGTGNPHLYVPAQGSDVVQVFDRMTLDPVTEIMISGAHGAAMTTSGRIFYTTNLPGGGSDALWAIETATNTVVAAGVDTNFTVPHNIAVTPNGNKIFVTHSGTNTTVSVFETRGRTPMPTLVDEITVGSNPFGIAYVP